MTINNTEEIITLTLPTPFKVGDVNVYLIKGDILTLVDAGPKTAQAWAVLQEQLRQHKIKLDDIDQVVVTHHHPDHVGLLDYLKPEKITIASFQYNEQWLKQDPVFLHYHHQFYKKLYDEMGASDFYEQEMKKIEEYLRFSCRVQLHQYLVEGDSIDGLSNWTVVETPGHAYGHISLFNEKTGIFIGGDHLIKHISSNAIIEPPGLGQMERPKSLLIYRDSLKKCYNLPIEKVLSGHGEAFTDAHGLIHERLVKQEERAEKIRQFIIKTPLTTYQICQQLFPVIYRKEIALTMSETIGHLDLLVDQGKAKILQENGILYYSAI